MNNPTSYPPQARPARRRRGCGIGCLLSVLMFLVIILILAGAGWLLYFRPYAHDIAQKEIDKALTSAVDQFVLPPEAALLQPGQQIPLTENGLNNTIVLHLAPANPVKNPETRITTSNVRISFQAYGFENAIVLVPKVENARLVVTNVTIEGIAGLIMSPEELTPLLNKHLEDAQQKLPRAISAVELRDHQMMLRLG
jgi:hypothetical protein